VTLRSEWPTLGRGGAWGATRDYLHLTTQMLGKLRLALAPPLPEWSHAPLSLTPQGLTTRALPWRDESVEAGIDLVEHAIRLSRSDSQVRSVALLPARPIAEIWGEFTAQLRSIGVVAELWDKPQERADVTRFSEDDRARAYDPDQARSWFALLTELHATFDTWRSPFFGRSGVNFWWGGFDLTVTLFNGRRAVPPPGSNYLMRFDLDAEHLSIGFWPGDDEHDAMFFGYLVPEPLRCAEYPLGVEAAYWASAMSEWVLPYEAVRAAADRDEMLRKFMDTIYRAAGDLGGWDLERFRYDAPQGKPTPSAPGRTARVGSRGRPSA
jgi:Family of unknown function (DUF5996)